MPFIAIALFVALALGGGATVLTEASAQGDAMYGVKTQVNGAVHAGLSAAKHAALNASAAIDSSLGLKANADANAKANADADANANANGNANSSTSTSGSTGTSGSTSVKGQADVQAHTDADANLKAGGTSVKVKDGTTVDGSANGAVNVKI